MRIEIVNITPEIALLPEFQFQGNIGPTGPVGSPGIPGLPGPTSIYGHPIIVPEGREDPGFQVGDLAYLCYEAVGLNPFMVAHFGTNLLTISGTFKDTYYGGEYVRFKQSETANTDLFRVELFMPCDDQGKVNRMLSSVRGLIAASKYGV